MEETYSIGRIRLQFLHKAEEFFTNGDFNKSYSKIGSFYHTLYKPETKTLFENKKEELAKKREERNKEILTAAEKEGYLEQPRVVANQQDTLEIELLDEQLNFCWEKAQELGLFDE